MSRNRDMGYGVLAALSNECIAYVVVEIFVV